jgi:xanthine dehydrogenase accessory factor
VARRGSADAVVLLGDCRERAAQALPVVTLGRRDTVSIVKELLPEIDRWRANGERIAVATVVATRRSSPRPVGSKLVVSERGELAGSVSGGCVESDVVLAAQDVLAGGAPRLLTYGITDDMALGIGLPCGGEIDVFVEPLE